MLSVKKQVFRDASLRRKQGTQGEDDWKECLGLKYADDMVWEFDSLASIKEWDEGRIDLW